MDDNSLAQVLMRSAKHDTFDDIGRIIVSDMSYDVADKTLTAERVKELFEKYYPGYDVEIRTKNIVLIYWSGKEAVKNARELRAPVGAEPEPAEQVVVDEKAVKGDEE